MSHLYGSLRSDRGGSRAAPSTGGTRGSNRGSGQGGEIGGVVHLNHVTVYNSSTT